jgi:Tfp pilus assembly PilM family ATPase
MLGSLTKPNYPKAAVGLEKDSVTALALERRGRGSYGIKQAATVPLPENLLTPNFLDQNISSHDELIVLLNEAVHSAGLARQKRWSVSLPSAAARTAILTLENEPASKQELEEILDWKAERSFGAPAAELRISQQKISPGADGKPRYFATAVKLNVLDEYETLFETMGWKAGLIMPRAVSEANWLLGSGGGKQQGDSLLISSQADGFIAVLLRGDEPAVVRTVTCGENEVDDEIYRLMMFYRDRFAADENGGNLLEKMLVVGKNFNFNRLREITAEALGATLPILRPEDVGLNIPASHLRFEDLAAPAGLATLAWN